MATTVPSLSTQGWLTTIGEKADRLLSYFFTNDYSQSVIFHGKIASLPYIIANYESEHSDLRKEIDNALNRLLSSFFERVETNVSIKPDDDTDTKYTVSVSVYIIDSNDIFELAKVVHIKDATIVKIVKILNG